jgi:hypothetical protein
MITANVLDPKIEALIATVMALPPKKEEEPPMTRTQEMQEMRKFVTSTPGGMT